MTISRRKFYFYIKIIFRKICGFKPISQDILMNFNKTCAPTPLLLSNINENRKEEKLPALFSFSTSCAFPPPITTNQTSKEDDFRKAISNNIDDEEIPFRSRVEAILREWISICYTPTAQIEPQHAFASISRMVCFFNLLKILKKVLTTFLRCS